MSRLPIHNHRSESQTPRLRKGGTPKAVRQLVDVLRRLYEEHLNRRASEPNTTWELPASGLQPLAERSRRRSHS